MRSALRGASRPNAVATTMPMVIAGTRPMRSATTDHGSTVTARASVVADTASAAVEGTTWNSAAICGSTACGEYSWAKVATPAKKSPASSLP